MAVAIRKASPVVVALVTARRWLTSRLAGFARRHPIIATLVGAYLAWHGALGVATHTWQAGATAFAAVTTTTAWRVLHPEHFREHVTKRIRDEWRDWWTYRRHWQAAMTLSGLTRRLQGVEQTPSRTKMASFGGFEFLLVRMLPGQVFEDWAKAAPRLAQSFGAADCRVQRTDDPQLLRLMFLHEDPLALPIAPPVLDDVIYPEALPVAATEYGEWYGLRLYGTHLLLAGVSGAGKSAAVWSILHALAPGLGRDVQLWLLDPKGGQEFYTARTMCHTFAPLGDGSPAEFADRLEDAVDIMRQRQAVLRETGAKHQIGPDMPWIVLLIDEIASLTSYNLDRDAKKRFEAALNLLLSQGRACGITVIGALQDPRKEVLTMRDLFPTRIGLRVSESTHVDMILGDGAREAGALCDRISAEAQGTAYVVEDGTTGVQRIRFAYIDDDTRADLLVRCVVTPDPEPTSAPESAPDEMGEAA